MTREQIERDYHVEGGIIRSPGKFEGEPSWAPFFYDLWGGLGHIIIFDDQEGVEFDIFQWDRADDVFLDWPELLSAHSVILVENDDEFIFVGVKE